MQMSCSTKLWGVQDQVVILTNQCIMKLRAPGFAQVHRAAESGVSPTSLMEVPPAEVRWAIPWQVPPHTCLYSTTGFTLKLESGFSLGRAKLQHSCEYISVHNDAKKAITVFNFVVGVVAGPVDSGAEVGQQGRGPTLTG